MELSTQQFNRMVKDHTPMLMRISVGMVGDKHEAEDLVQEAFSSAWRSRDLFEAERGSEKAWLARILKRRVVDQWRKPKPPITLTTGDPLAVLSFDDDPFQNEFSTEINDALSQLPDSMRTTFLLVAVDEFTHQEAADHLGISVGTALSRVSRARKRMHQHLGVDFCRPIV